jgi:2'-hydroxyisoflavone reductase
MRSTRREFLKTSMAVSAVAGLNALPGQFLVPAWADADLDTLRDQHLRDLPWVKEKAGKPLKILIMGGTAFIGPAFANMALARGHELTFFNRGRTNPHLFPGVEKIQGDRTVAEDVEQLRGREWDVVLDNSCYYPRVIDMVADIVKDVVKQYVVISTISVYAGYEEIGMTEDAPLATLEDPTTEEVTGETYGGLKVLCEQAAQNAMPDKTTVIRPGLIVGPMDRTDRFTYWPVRVDRGGEVLAPGVPDQGIQFIDVRDLMSFTLKCIEEQRLGVYHCTGKAGAVTTGRLLDGSKKIAGSDAKFTWVPADFLEEKEVAAWQEMPCWLPPEGEYAGFGSVDVSRAMEAGLTFRALDKTVADTLEWWKLQPENPEGPRTELRAGIAPEKEASVLEAWHAREEGE